MTGQYLTVWQCIRTDQYELRFNTPDVDACYEDIPITYTLNNVKHDAFLTTSDFIIVPRSYPKKCSFTPLHYLLNELCWDGKNITTCKVHPTELIFMDSFPKLRQMRLNIAQVHDASAEALNTITRLLDVETGLQALTRLFEITATDVEIHPAEIKQLALAAGINTVNFIATTLKTAITSIFPSWLIYLFLTVTIFLVIFTVTIACLKYVYPLCNNCNIFPHNCFTFGHVTPAVAYNVANADIVITEAPQVITNDLEIDAGTENLPLNTPGLITDDMDSQSLPPPPPYHQTEL